MTIENWTRVTQKTSTKQNTTSSNSEFKFGATIYCFKPFDFGTRFRFASRERAVAGRRERTGAAVGAEWSWALAECLRLLNNPHCSRRERKLSYQTSRLRSAMTLSSLPIAYSVSNFNFRVPDYWRATDTVSGGSRVLLLRQLSVTYVLLSHLYFILFYIVFTKVSASAYDRHNEVFWSET